MKIKKIKNILFTFIICLFGALAFNSIKANALGFEAYSYQNRIQDSQYIYYYNNIPYYSYNGMNLYYDSNSDSWVQFGGNTSIAGDYVRQIDDTLYYFGGANRNLKYGPSTNGSWVSFTSNQNYYGNYTYFIDDVLYYSNGSTHAVLDSSTMTWSNVTWSGLTSFYGTGVFDWNDNLYYLSGNKLYIKNDSVLEWTLLSQSLSGSFNGADIWVYQNELYHTNYSNASVYPSGSFVPTYKYNPVTFNFESVSITGSLRFGGRMVYYVNNEPYFAYYYSIYKLNYVASGDITQEDVTNAYNNGYYVGHFYGENHDIVPSSCTYYVDILQGDCSDDYLVSNGIIDFDEANDIANSYGSNFLITFTFDNLIPVNDYFIKWHDYGGATISFYKNDSIIYAIDTRGLADHGNVYTFTTPDSFDKIVVNNVNYDYSIYSFGYLNSDSFDLGYDEGYLLGEDTGFDTGYDRGYDIGFSQGTASNNTLVGMVGAIFTGPVTMFQQIFNFNVLGINFAEMLLGLVTLLVVIWLIKKFI